MSESRMKYITTVNILQSRHVRERKNAVVYMYKKKKKKKKKKYCHSLKSLSQTN